MGRRWAWIVGLALGVALVALIFLWRPWRPAVPPAPPHVVLVTVDALRRDHLGAYGSELQLTPQLDSLAHQATVFERAVAPTPVSAAGLASILTGRLPIQHRLRTDRHGTLRNLELTLPERLKAAGYLTAAFLGSRYPKETNLTQGCDTLVAPAGPERDGAQAARELVDWLARAEDAGAPRFAWLHLAEPGGPWRAPFPWSLQHLEHPYRAEVAAVDFAVGLLRQGLRERGLAHNTHVIVVGSCGEALGEQGEIEHGILLEPSTLQVPWLWRRPGGGGSPRPPVTGLVSTTDLMPTLLAMLEIPLASSEPGTPAPDMPVEGHSRVGAMERDEPTLREHLLLETFLPQQLYGWAPLLGLWTDSHLLVSGSSHYVFNVQTAPHRAQAMTADLEVLAAGMLRTVGQEIERWSPLAQDVDGWRDWGRGQPDPYRRISMSSDLIEASRDLQYGDPHSAQRHAQRLTARYPDNPRVQALRAYTHLRQGEYLAAERAFREILDRFSVACEIRLGLAECLLSLGNPGSAESALGSMRPDSLGACLWLLVPDPDLDFRHWRLRGLAAARQGRCDEAVGHFARAADSAQLPSQHGEARSFVQAARVVADALGRVGRIHPREHDTVIRSALELGWPEGIRRILELPGAAPADGAQSDSALDLVLAYEAMEAGDLDHAAVLLKRALAVERASSRDVMALARALELRGRGADAVALIQHALPLLGQTADLYFALAVLQAGERSTGEAAANLETAIRLGFEEWDRLLGRRLRRMVNREELQRHWQSGPRI